MPFAHSITITVFASGDEDVTEKTLRSIFPFILEEQKIVLQAQKTEGFEDKTITVFKVQLLKHHHTDSFLKSLLQKLSKESKVLLQEQLDSRLDDNLDFFIRLDKEKFIGGEYHITESGNCFHIRMSVAAFPHKREVARDVVKNMLSSE